MGNDKKNLTIDGAMIKRLNTAIGELQEIKADLLQYMVDENGGPTTQDDPDDGSNPSGPPPPPPGGH